MSKKYIAYGSNMDLEQMKYRCPNAKLIGTGNLIGWRLMFKGSQTGAYATIERDEKCTVPILLWDISKADEKRLDFYEGFPTFYYKKNVQVADSTITKGMAYIMHEERKLGVPTMYYYDVLYRAYLKFGFDLKILENAYRYTLAHQTN